MATRSACMCVRACLCACVSCTHPYVCVTHFIPAWRCATFGSFARCLHLNPQEMENGLRSLKPMLRSDSLLFFSLFDAALSNAQGLTSSATVVFED